MYNRGDKSRAGEVRGDLIRGRWARPYCTYSIDARAGRRSERRCDKGKVQQTLLYNRGDNRCVGQVRGDVMRGQWTIL